MELHHLKIEGFRKHYSTDIRCRDATFLIGENNIGKSSVLAALEYLLNDIRKIPNAEFFTYKNEEGDNECLVDKIILTAEFHNVPVEALAWRGFRGRVIRYGEMNDEDTGLKIVYRKVYRQNSDYQVMILSHPRKRKECYTECKTISDFISNGICEEEINSIMKGIEESKAIPKKDLDKLNMIDEIWEIDESTEEWIENPGGIAGVVLSKLPKFLLIPAQDKVGEFNENNGTLAKTLREIFCEVRDSSENFKKAQEYLNLLAKELDPKDDSSELGEMMSELNTVLGEVFPQAGINAMASLSKADDVIKPQFQITMHSNIATEVSLQGTGMIRAGVFALLRYKTSRDLKRKAEGEYIRPLIIGFEEPEIYLHPNAAMQMRETIYSLAENSLNQIICTTHSPYMIDLSKKPNQVLNSLKEIEDKISFQGVEHNIRYIKANPFSISAAFKVLLEDEKHYIKMLLKIDDDVSKVFFTERVLIVEGDTEALVMKAAISRMNEEDKKAILSKWTIVKARGKAVIISLVKYLKAMGIEPIVMHDKDTGVSGAECFNEPIKQAVGVEENLIVVEDCIEDILGYEAPSYEKPLKAYRYIKDNWGSNWESIPPKPKAIFEKIFFRQDDCCQAVLEAAMAVEE